MIYYTKLLLTYSNYSNAFLINLIYNIFKFNSYNNNIIQSLFISLAQLRHRSLGSFSQLGLLVEVDPSLIIVSKTLSVLSYLSHLCSCSLFHGSLISFILAQILPPKEISMHLNLHSMKEPLGFVQGHQRMLGWHIAKYYQSYRHIYEQPNLRQFRLNLLHK